jgi:hypothetical protein
VIFHTKYPNNFRASFRSVQFFQVRVAAIIIGGINPNTQKKQQFVESHRQTL